MMNLAKCYFFESKVKILGYMVGNELVKPYHSL